MRVKLRFIAFAIMATLYVVGVASCRQEAEQDLSSLAFEQSTITLEEGATCQLRLQGIPEGASVMYASENPSVATVDAEQGLVLAIAEGETTITARVGKASVSCRVVVSMLNEMPLLIFNPKVEGDKVVDERILEHERLVGRQYTEAVPVNMQHVYTLPGFYNERLQTVTCVIYNQHFEEVQEDLIMAYCTEPITHLDKVKKLLAPLGFTRFEARKFEGTGEVYIYSPSDIYLGLSINIRQTDQIHLNARSFIHFFWERRNAAPCKYHPTIPNVKDFPSLEEAAKGEEQILAYEQSLGFRQHDGYNVGYRFNLVGDKMDLSNISYADYLNGDEEMGVSILSRMLCVQGQEDILSQELKDYLTCNGYGENFQYLFGETALLGLNKMGDACLVFIESTQGVCWMYLLKKGHHGYSPQALQFVKTHSLTTQSEWNKLRVILK